MSTTEKNQGPDDHHGTSTPGRTILQVTKAPGSVHQGPRSTLRILVCDDDEVLMTMIRFKLSRENLGEIVKAVDGRDAINLLRKEHFDLIITDIHMPFHSGLELISVVRQELKLDTPIIVLTAEGLEETLMHAYDLGANDFIAKPFSPAELTIRVKHLMSKK
jgi:DNA-binding response OmpR family regulator